MNALWKASSMEVKLTLDDVCSQFLQYASVPGYKTPLTVPLKKTLKPILIKRAQALTIIGQIYRQHGQEGKS